MPWRDIAVKLTGNIVHGFKKHFLEFWNFNNIQFAYKRSILRNISQKTEEFKEFNELRLI